MKKVYWTTKSGDKIDIDEMSIDHLRNILKMIVRQSYFKQSPNSIETAEDITNQFSDNDHSEDEFSIY